MCPVQGGVKKRPERFRKEKGVAGGPRHSRDPERRALGGRVVIHHGVGCSVLPTSFQAAR